ncbi:DUF2851 family protein [Chryseobacterium nematophagum]|uniref:DUF2851 family protein n=1 Tax=Chryseobacterium nematophagum TaxID=2305228 RepID=A0A3M7TBQ6_9FLAO|nr:DUF2851 family protein [Chryseobacterium nematophagum]RNA60608.1 DUF2851 family protein [Chryseobacterium nematophagum]
MTEKLLQYLWNYKIFNNFDFKDINGNAIEILEFGTWNTDAGPDFLRATIKINGLILAGNIELHVKSSDWIFHHHSKDPNYKNMILHVVFYNDIDIDELRIKNVPTLELKHHIDEKIIDKYGKLVDENQFIACENVFSKNAIPIHFHEQNILKKLEEKSLELEKSLEKYTYNFEAVLFHNLAYSFGLKVNALLFKQIAENVDFSIINKIRQNVTQLEALLFGISGWLDTPQDTQMQIWKREFDFIKVKFKISDIIIHPKFLRLRPPNFPTIRLSQLANLYHTHQNLFSKIIHKKNSRELFDIFGEIKATEYWNNHFNFGKISKVDQPKGLSKDFIELIILNTVLPLKYKYQQYQGEDNIDTILDFYKSISAEKNSIINNWSQLGLKAKDSLESQSLIYHFRHSCEAKKCLNCGIGLKILKESANV